jgi:ABC-type transporter Mla MlaB component
MGIRKDDSSTEFLLIVDGRAQVDEAEELAGEFRRALDSSSRVFGLDLEGITDVDVSFLQLLLSLSLSLTAQGRVLAIRTLPKGHVLIERATLLGLDLNRLFAGAEGVV